MSRLRLNRLAPLCFAAMALLTACGGGGGSSSGGTALTAPTITTQPASQTVVAETLVSLTVAASGNPSPTYQWESSPEGSTTWTSISGATNASYSFICQASQDGTRFHAVAANSAGTVTSNAATLTVESTPVAPTITTQPTSQTVPLGAVATFTVVASGSPVPTIQWQSRATASSAWTAISGATSASYSFQCQSGQDGYQFCAVATNSAGTATSDAATLSVSAAAAAPVLITQPLSQTAEENTTVSFTVAASGSPAPTFQWSQSTDGTTWTAISGATGTTYSFTCTSSQNGMQFRAAATNASGTATSDAATLTVTPAGNWTVYTPLASTDDLAQGSNLLANPGFDSTSGSLFAGWSAFSSGYVVDTSTSHTGSASAKCTATATGQWHGLYQFVTLNQTTAKPLVISAWSKASGVSGSADYQYAAYVVLYYTDGTTSAGYFVNFPVGTQAWNQVTRVVIPTKPVLQAELCLVIDGDHTGTVWFDDASLSESSEQAYSFQETTVKNVAVTSYPYAGSSSLSLSTGDGLSLALSAKGGAVTSLVGSGQQFVDSDSIFASGFFLRDVGNASDYIHPSTTVSQTSSTTLSLAATSTQLGLALNAVLTSSSDRISVTGTLADTTAQDRAVTLYFALPVDARGWTWGDDLRTSVTLGSNQEHGNYSEVPFGVQFTSLLTPPDLTGRMSLYPMASISNGDGLALAYPLNSPAQVRFFVNTYTGQLLLAYDLGLSQHAKTAGTASFSFVIFRHDPTWGFRAAWSKYIALYPSLFQKRATTEGLWFTGVNAYSIPTPVSDFHLAFHEMTTGNDSANMTYDNNNSIMALRYTYTPTSYLLVDTAQTHPASYYATPANVIAALEAGLSSSDTSTQSGSAAALASGMLDASGNLISAAASNIGGTSYYGARITVDSDPNVSDPDYTTNTAAFKWNDTLKAVYSQTSPVLNGDYIDSLEYTPTVLGYRNIHLAASDLPLVFDTSYRPALPEIWSAYEFARWMAADIHTLSGNRLVMGNGTLGSFAFPAYVFDVLGTETSWLDSSNAFDAPSDAWFNFKRALSYQKPYCLLLETWGSTAFSVFTNAMIERYFQTALFYGMYPGIYGQVGTSYTVYWSNSTWVERDRSLFKKYIPLIQTLGTAGWQPITYATSSNANVAIERFGSGSSLCLTVRNLTSQSQTATITLSTSGLGLSSVPASFTDQVNGGTVTVSTSGPSFQITLDADEVRMYQ